MSFIILKGQIGLQMNFHHMMSQYKDIDIISKVEGASKYDFIKIVLEELYVNLHILADAIKTKSKASPEKSKSFAKSLTSLMILMDSLDFKKGEPIASNLFNLYDYCRRSVIDDYQKLETDGIISSANVIADILSGWKEIK
mgnify:FL=1